jgi:hypothetical protein
VHLSSFWSQFLEAANAMKQLASKTECHQKSRWYDDIFLKDALREPSLFASTNLMWNFLVVGYNDQLFFVCLHYASTTLRIEGLLTDGLTDCVAINCIDQCYCRMK